MGPRTLVERRARPYDRLVPHRPAREQSVARAVAAFALSGLVVVVLLGVAAVEVLRAAATREATRDARAFTALSGDAVVAPALTPAALRGDPAARAALRRAVGRVVGGSVVRVKLWDADGRIVFSDEPRLVGDSFELGEEELDALRGGGSDAEVSDLDEPENRFERGQGRLLEVYKGIRTPQGTRLLFETYQRSSAIAASGHDIWRRFVPLLLGALVVLELLQIPLAYLLARRLRDRQRERQVLLQRAVDASEAERRAVAAALHDGPVQDLAGVSFALAAGARGARADEPARELFADAATRTRETMRDLRTMLVDLYPATLHRQGLGPALADLLAPLAADGIETRLDVAPALSLPEDAERLLFRGAREALQNVRKHAGAQHVRVSIVLTDADTAVLRVEDDGRGFDPPRAGGRSAGHLGLALLDDLVGAAGGRLELDAAPGRGTRLRIEVPR
jgi:two-component system, NarL family, sensor kinase